MILARSRALPDPTQAGSLAIQDPTGTLAKWYLVAAVVCVPGPP
jgi:hypothetical protein